LHENFGVEWSDADRLCAESEDRFPIYRQRSSGEGKFNEMFQVDVHGFAECV
jgi:hypothetical protein